MVGCIENTVASAACCLPDEFVLCPCNYQPHVLSLAHRKAGHQRARAPTATCGREVESSIPC